ncbi:MAG TPA: hypothetical protein VI423_09225 [Paenisporosarcina sp.]|nr:hypothetical protein [Paenisporosarcina sp.]
MNLAYTEISNEEADRIIKTANLKTLAELVDAGRNEDAYDLAEGILST